LESGIWNISIRRFYFGGIRMNRAITSALLSFMVWMHDPLFSAPLRFEKVGEHCYYLQLKGGGENVFAVVTDDGILIVNPPSEPDLSVAADALKRVSGKAVRWVAFSSPRAVRSAGARFFSERGATLLAGAQLRSILTSLPPNAQGTIAPGSNSGELPSFPWLIFDHQMHLFPQNLEIRITALQHKAQTGGDVVVYVPAEKVLFVGGMYEAARYPDIDTAAQGDANDWIDGLKQVVDSIPVLKPAIPPTKTDSKAGIEKTVEEGIAVISAHGEVSNFQNMKDLLGASQKLRADITKSIKAGRECEDFLNSSRASIYRSYSNFDPYASALCESLSAGTDK
jgi:glyoxylase-like metal-dependent hydrolase (beta-lactamase superfamily II)